MSVEVIERPKQIVEWEVYCQECDRIIATVGDYTTAHDLRFAHENNVHLLALREGETR